jgi:membrane protein
MQRLATAARILKESIRNYAVHNGLGLSASISFYAMFSFFPLLLLTLSIVATIVGSSEVAMARMSSIVSNLTPVGAQIVVGWVESAAETKPLAWGIGILGVVWGARHVFNTLAYSASVIWGKKGWMEVILRQLVALILVGVTALVLLISIILPGVVDRLREDAGVVIGGALGVGVRALPYVLAFVMFWAIYSLTSPRNVSRKHVLFGAVVVSATWEIAKTAFLGYIHLTRITSVYGSIGGMIVLMTWIYFSSAIVLWGMELVAATAAEPKEVPHLRRAKGVLVIE